VEIIAGQDDSSPYRPEMVAEILYLANLRSIPVPPDVDLVDWLNS
jgi:hypothetical protein